MDRFGDYLDIALENEMTGNVDIDPVESAEARKAYYAEFFDLVDRICAALLHRATMDVHHEQHHSRRSQ